MGPRVFFHEAITPLRRQLIEFRALAERHEKLASLGVLAAGVAHEIRNPLTAIKLRTYLFRENLAEGAPADDDVTVIEREINRLERIVNDFLVFAHPGDPQLALLSARDVFQETAALLAPELAGNAIELCVESGADDMLLRADAHQLKQVLINLVRNAAESIGEKGRITLRTRTDHLALHGRPQEVIVLEVEVLAPAFPRKCRSVFSIRSSPPRLPAPASAFPSPCASSNGTAAPCSSRLCPDAEPPSA